MSEEIQELIPCRFCSCAPCFDFKTERVVCGNGDCPIYGVPMEADEWGVTKGSVIELVRESNGGAK
jgi:hypothetical protein